MSIANEVIGSIWRSSQNGKVYATVGLAPTLCVVCHNGVEPKIIVVYEYKE